MKPADAYRRGRAAGYRNGIAEGYHWGRCEAIVRQTAFSPPRWNVRVLFVPQGFESIDRGIAEALRRTVAELIVGDAARMDDTAAEVLPDLVLVLNGLHVFPERHADQVDRIRALGVRTAIWFADDPYFTADTAGIAPKYDHVFTHEPSCAGWYASLGCRNVDVLPMAADPVLFRPGYVDPRYRSDVCFIGTAFPNRAVFFDELAEFLAGLRIVVAGGLWDERLEKYELLRRHIRPGYVPAEECAMYYRGTRIALNLHRSANEVRNAAGLPGTAPNPRTFEAAACGTLVLTDARAGLPGLYEPGAEVAVYATPEEAMRLIRRYLDREDERRRIARNGLRRTLREHTYVRRLVRLLGAVFGEPSDRTSER